MSVQWEQDPKTRDYKVEKGVPVQTSSLIMAAYYRLKVQRKKWLYAPDVNYGSDFHLIKKHHTTGDPSAIENTAVRALRPLIEDGRSKEIEVTAVETARHGLGLSVKIEDSRGKNEDLKLEPIGI